MISVLFPHHFPDHSSSSFNKSATSDFIPNRKVKAWLTTADQKNLLRPLTDPIVFGPATKLPSIDVDAGTRYQSIDGFGYTLTSGSATLIYNSGKRKKALLQELFGKGPQSIGISYLRISIGASDLSAGVYSYDDLPPGETDPDLKKFSLQPDRSTGLIPLLREIKSINRLIKILATPWSPPHWMKDNDSSKGGSLQRQYYPVYAKYFVRYINEMKREGIVIDAITPQNEPLHPGNNPSMLMVAEEQRDFIREHLGPAFLAANISTRIIVYDHNCDYPGYPLTILNDPEARKFVDGSAFHLYNGDISALSSVHNAHPDRHVYFTEQWTSSAGEFGGDLLWHIKHVIIGSMRNWSRTALEWNLANDTAYGPHTPGGCMQCKGALTIGDKISRNVAYYIIAHVSKFVPPGSVRIESTELNNLFTVAFETPAKKKVLIVLNEAGNDANFSIHSSNEWAAVRMPAKSVVTFEWENQ
jgi:glucosylceramidase